MENEYTPYISVTDPISRAIDRVKMILFEPFDLVKWFVIGFCAFLANLGGGGNPGGGNGGGRSGGGSPDFGREINEFKEFVSLHLPIVIAVAIIGFILITALLLVLAWLSSRGRFMFLHCVAHNKAEVVFPWNQFRDHANSLFLFRIVLGTIGFVVIIVPVIFIVFLGISLGSQNIPAPGAIAGIVILGFVTFLFGISIGVVSKFTNDFVVPIMFLRTVSIRDAWREFMSLLSLNKGKFFVYLLFQIVIGLATGMIILAAVICTCCCACCLSMIPYIGTVLFLPIHVFKRSYSLYYLQQYGQQFNVFYQPVENPQPQLPENPYNI